MKTSNIFFLIIIALVFNACTERFDIELDDQQYAKLVVDGSLTSDTTTQIIKLKKTSNYFENEKAQLVSGAEVYVSSSIGDTIIFFENATSGYYESGNNVYGISDISYKLHIHLAQEIGGSLNYESQEQLMNPVAKLDSIGLAYYEEWGNIWEIQVYAYDPPRKDFYLFRALINDTLVTDTIHEYFVQSDDFFNGNYTNGVGSQYLDANKAEQYIEPGDKITFEISGINESYYDYVTNAQLELMGQNPMFSGPPANLIGNINNGALGYFAVYASERSSVILE